MKKRVKTTGKIISIVLTLCMIVTLFAGLDLSPMTVSASASDTNLFHVTTSATAKRIGWRSSTKGSHISSATKYRLSLDWENVSNAPFGSTVFGIYCYTTYGWRNIWGDSQCLSEWNISSYRLAHGTHYDIDFTTAALSECRELVFYFGDINKSISSMEFKTANWMLYTRDASNNLTATSMTPTFGSADFRQASSGAMDSFVSSYSSQANNTYFWTDYLGSSFSCAFEAIPSGYFNTVEQMIHAKAGYIWDTIAYRGGALSAGNYQFTVDEAAVGGVKSTVQLFTGDSLSTGATKTSDVLVGLKRTVKFTVSATSKFLLWVGERDGNNAMNTFYRYPELYQLDGSGNPTGSNLISHFNTSNVVIQNSHNERIRCALGKWTTLNQGDGAIAAADIDSASFLISQMIHFPAGYNNYHTIAYRGGALSGGTYRFTVEECTKTGIKSSVQIFLGDSFGTEVWDIRLDKLDGTTRTVEFNFGSNYSRFLLWIGNRGNGTNMDTYYRNPVLKKLDGSGNPTGNNLVNNFNTANINLTSNINSKTACVEGKWNSVNYASGYIVADNMLTGNTYFDLVYLGGDYNNTGTTDVFDYVEYKKVRAGLSFTGLSQDCNQDGVGPDGTDFAKLRNTVLGLS